MIRHTVRTTVAIAALSLAVLSSPMRAQDAQTRFVEDVRAFAAAGDGAAQFLLGFMYAAGRGVPQDDVEAVAWYRKAAEQGLANAQFSLGEMYREGRSVPQDDAEAVAWFRTAAEQDHADAQFSLGGIYREGRGVPQDDAEAVAWFRHAAAQGHARAQFNLGLLYDQGRGVPQDDVEAHTWLSLAAFRSTGADYDRIGTARTAVAARMTAADLSEAQRRAREWTAAHQTP